MKIYNKIMKVKNFANVAIVVHANPDADALCSASLMFNFLKSIGVEGVDIFTDCNEIPFNFLQIIKGCSVNPTPKEYDCVLMMDTSSSERLGKYASIYDNASYKINIDHHLTNPKSADINYVETISSATELTYKILKENGYKFTKADYGKVYVGIMSDTGCLSVGVRTEKTYNIVGKCYANIDAGKIYSKIIATNSLKNMQLLALSINNMKVIKDGAILITHISKDESRTYNSKPEDYTGIVNRLQNIQGSKFICFIYPNSDGQYYVSMRCKEGYSVEQVASKYNGGGHVCAAAFRSMGDIEDIENKVLPLFEDQLTNLKVIDDDVFDE